MVSGQLHLLVGFSTAPAAIPTKLNATHPSKLCVELIQRCATLSSKCGHHQHLIQNPRPRAAPSSRITLPGLAPFF
ncbi:hypothetical protein B0H16DRAFT_1562711 [Mycena metata]|uniref:Uncharacterized protein n=1 Tax=Mycena metata TaxID=1033252 RepID=A0AAD7IJN2_9AGAR|nr:hypothetical protein B0H16DRAFT_1562711 [Mycena metata]